MKLSSPKWRVAAVVALILLLFLLRPGASRLKSRIILSMSSAIGRPVDIGSVHVRILPRPGFELENLVVYDDPSFGAEPMLRAGEVTASLRLTSLLRGRLEIARLDLNEPSLNLVRNANGRWNLEMLLERTAHTPLAPTAKAKTEPRPAFPYIDCSSARINFKNGPEKKAYALTNADFALWQDSENAWGVRLKAQPFRTDLNLSDTGTLQLNGTWQRADALRDTPLQLNLEWNRAQLGQLTKFFTGNDQGWRGGVLVDVALTGTPAKLQIATHASITDFRRYDITSGDPLLLSGDCTAEYHASDRSVHDLGCRAPVGGGVISVKGDLGLPAGHNYDLVVSAENVPASAVLGLAQRTKKNLPADLAVSGSVRGSFILQESAEKSKLEGRGEATDLRLTSLAEKADLGPFNIPFVLADRSGRSREQHKKVSAMRFPEAAHVEFGPVGRAGGTLVQAWAARSGYSIAIAGESEISRILRTMKLFGIPASQSSAQGSAQLDLLVAGSWTGQTIGASAGFSGPQVTGTARLKNVQVAVRGAGGPVEILSAEMSLLPDRTRVEKLSAKAAGATWTGSLELPRGCGSPAACPVRFNLSANQITLTGMNSWISPNAADRPWYRVLAPNLPKGPPFLATVAASGRVTTDRLQVQNLAATHASANVVLNGGKLAISDLSGNVLGGKYHGQWQADFSKRPAPCEGSGTFTAVSLAQVATSMNDEWVAGTASSSYELKGSCSPEFWSSAEGTLQFEMRDGILPHVSLGTEGGSLKVVHFAGRAALHAGKLELKDAKLESSGGKFQVTGSATLKRELDFKLGPAAGYAITGTLAEPRVAPLAANETQARLKP